MNKLKLSIRLALLLSIPLAGLLFFGAYGALEKWQVDRDYARLEGNAAVMDQIGETVHELQRERGRSGVFVNSRGARFSAELKAQLAASDAVLERLRAMLGEFSAASFGPGFQRIFDESLKRLGDLPEKRRAIGAFEITGSDSTIYYTHTIAGLLDVIVAMSHLSKDAAIANGIQSYVNFLQAKEQAGIERATLAQVFTQDRFTADAFNRWAQASAAQETYFRVFASFASAEQKAFWETQVSGRSVDMVKAMRATAFEKREQGGFGVPPADWFDASTARIDLMKAVEDRLASDYAVQATEVRQNARLAFRIFGLLTLAIIGGTATFGVYVIRSIVRPLRRASESLAAGSEQIRSASGQVSNSSQSLAEGASEQAASLEETSASLEEIASMGKRNAEAANQATVLSSQTRQSAEMGSREMSAMVAAMGEITASATNVQKIVKTIDEIAFQTNILALNAAVEAARAGEAGAGFAIVAEEVRALAQRSATAARETAGTIEDVVQKSDRGSEVSGRVANHLAEILQHASSVDRLVAEIASASGEQCTGVEEVNKAVSQMDKVTQQTAATAEESAAAAEELNAQAQEFGTVVRDLTSLVNGAQGSPAPENEPMTFSSPAHPPVPPRTKANSKPDSRLLAGPRRTLVQPARNRVTIMHS